MGHLLYCFMTGTVPVDLEKGILREQDAELSLTCALAATVSLRSSAILASPRSACCLMDTGADPESSSKALTPSVTHPAQRSDSSLAGPLISFLAW